MTDLLWNKEIAAACNWRVPDEFPPNQPYSVVPQLAGAIWSKRLPTNLISNPAAFAAVRDSDLIWVRLSWLKSFIHQALPFIRSRFILVTGDSDSSVPAELRHEAQILLDCPRLLHWYTQNYDASLPSARISPIPIGIDFHTLAQQPMWGETVSPPEEQERTLHSVRGSLPPLADRIPRVYMDFGWKRGLGLFHYRRFHRLAGAASPKPRPQVAWELRNHRLVHIQTGPLSRTEMWRQRGRYAFVLSVPGMGLDCHRTWEALALGHIVLTPPSSLDRLYEGLPVRIVNNWKDIHEDNLRDWLAAEADGRHLPEGLTNGYWVAHMRRIAHCNATTGLCATGPTA